jgi:hypothetical protein
VGFKRRSIAGRLGRAEDDATRVNNGAQVEVTAMGFDPTHQRLLPDCRQTGNYPETGFWEIVREWRLAGQSFSQADFWTGRLLVCPLATGTFG